MERKIFNFINILIVLLCISTLLLLSYNIYKLNIIPNKYLLVGFIIVFLGILILLLGLLSFNSFIKNISRCLLVIMSLIFILITMSFDKTYAFLSNLVHRYDTLNYSVIVKNDSNYQRIEDLKDKTIAYFNEYSEIEKELTKKVTFNKQELDDSLLYSKLIDNEVDAIILEDGYLALLKDEIEDFESNTKVIYTFKIKIKAHEEEEKKIDVTLEPFIIYISGIDQYGNVNSVRGRSDVNQLMVINPKTHHILIANTPRDYYVQLAGTTGLRDKLTHAGIYGIEKSISTIENLYGIDINHYIRINFDTLIKVVDVLGGVDIYSEKAFQPWTNSHVYINQGNIHLNGTEALAYARERKTYVDGDHHRGRNQQQIIEAIISKLTDTNTFLSKYNSILKTLEGSFQTDMDTSLITGFIKYQLDKMPSWKVDSVSVNGYSSWNYTYSMGYNYYLWVMEPDWNSVNDIKNKILEVLNEG